MHTGVLYRTKYPSQAEYEVLFWSNVKTIGASDDDCWEWDAGLNSDGYGRFSVNNKRFLSHRLAYTWMFGDIPSGLVIDHLCRNRKCVNPLHMELVTPEENVRRGEKSKRTHCIRGHALSGTNLKIRKNGTRFCIACSKERYTERKSKCL